MPRKLEYGSVKLRSGLGQLGKELQVLKARRVQGQRADFCVLGKMICFVD